METIRMSVDLSGKTFGAGIQVGTASITVPDGWNLLTAAQFSAASTGEGSLSSVTQVGTAVNIRFQFADAAFDDAWTGSVVLILYRD